MIGETDLCGSVLVGYGIACSVSPSITANVPVNHRHPCHFTHEGRCHCSLPTCTHKFHIPLHRLELQRRLWIDSTTRQRNRATGYEATRPMTRVFSHSTHAITHPRHHRALSRPSSSHPITPHPCRIPGVTLVGSWVVPVANTILFNIR